MGTVQSPLIGLEMTPEVATYVGLLERQVGAYAIQEAKFRALLEIMTGESWETTKLDIDGNMLMALAVESLCKATGMSTVAAKTLVTQRWNDLNGNISTVPAPKSVPIEKLVEGIRSPENDSIPVSPRAFDMKSRLADWKERQKAAVATTLEQNEGTLKDSDPNDPSKTPT